jgi:MFS family permease
VLGGVLTEYAGWRSIFLVNPAVIVVLVAALWWLVPAGGRDRSVSLDLPGALVVTVSIGALIYGLSQGQQHGFTGAAAITAFAAAVALGAMFIGIETRTRSPMVPLNMLADRARRTALVVMLFVGAAIGCYVYFTSLYLQRVLGFTPLLTGVSMLPSTVTVLLVSMFVTPRLIGRFSVARLLFAGLVLMGAGLTWLSRMSATGTYQADVLGGLLLIALGMGVVIPAASVSVAAGMSSDERGLASALFATVQQVGQAVGLAVLATIAAARTASAHGSLVSGYRLSYLVTLAGVVVLALMLLRPARLLRPLTEERKL